VNLACAANPCVRLASVGDPVEGRLERTAQKGWREALRAADNYGLLLIMLVADIGLLILLQPHEVARLIQTVFVVATMLVALRTSRVRRFAWRLAVAVSAAALSFAILQAIYGGEHLAGWTYVMMSMLLLVTLPAILRRIFAHAVSEQGVVTSTILGAVCAYVLLGLAFAFIFLSIDALSDQPFFRQSATTDPAAYVYMSYVTMTTVGFGDLTPATDLGRMLVVIEALLGQIYLVTTVARLVATLTPRRPPSVQRADPLAPESGP
jgi:Ion channel